MESGIPRSEYPRPDFERPEWINLNGEWDFELDDSNMGEMEKWYLDRNLARKIIVPFCFQSKLSGIEDRSFHDVVWYKRKFVLSDHFSGRRVILNFGAVDYHTKVWINGEMAGEHTGGYSSFKFDITNLLKQKENIITIRVEDKGTNTLQPRGKQSWKEQNFGCWYTQVTGIWQTVWLEAVAETYIESVKITPDIDMGNINLDVKINGNLSDSILNVFVAFDGIEIIRSGYKLNRNTFSASIDIKSEEFEWKLKAWSPDEPNLYDINYELVRQDKVLDSVKSYFGMRKVSTRNGAVLLNNQPIYQRLVLDQGYYDGGLLTAASDEDFIRDIKTVKEFGFNGVRKHQKVEDPRFLYWADKLGILVWGEMGSAYEFNDDMITSNISEWRGTILRDYNHPSIIAWTLMNESWGVPNIIVNKKQQYHTASLYYMAKSFDTTRLVISNDGWEHTVSDIITFHDYTQDGEVLFKKIIDKDRVINESVCSIGNLLGAKYLFAEGYEYNGQPILLSECGGAAYDTHEGWGYGTNVKSEEEFMERCRGIIKSIYKTDYIMGFCFTQLTDVEQEVNGLLTIDRKLKVDPSEFSSIILNKYV